MHVVYLGFKVFFRQFFLAYWIFCFNKKATKIHFAENMSEQQQSLSTTTQQFNKTFGWQIQLCDPLRQHQQNLRAKADVDKLDLTERACVFLCSQWIYFIIRCTRLEFERRQRQNTTAEYKMLFFPNPSKPINQSLPCLQCLALHCNRNVLWTLIDSYCH